MSADQLSAFLDELGKRLGPAGSHVFDLAVRQQLIAGAIETLVGLLILAGGIVAFAVMRRHEADGFEWMALGLGFVFGGVFFFSALPLLLNPEWQAISDILRAVK